MFSPRSLPRFSFSLFIMLIVAARAEAQSIPLPAETPRAGAYVPPEVRARSKAAWRPKGSVVPAQAEEFEQPTSEPGPTLAPPLAEPALEIQYLPAPANAPGNLAEPTNEQERDPRPIQPLPPRANPLREARRPQTMPPSYQTQRNPIQRAQNPVDVEVDPEPIPLPMPPRVPRIIHRHQNPADFPSEVNDSMVILQEHEPAAPRLINQLPPSPNSRRIVGEVDDRTGMLPDPKFVTPTDDGYNPADEQVPGEELYGLPRVHETNAYGRFSGRGEPLTAGSWLNRPYYVGGFIGGIGGDTLVENEIKANGGFFLGGNIGWDYDPYWGLEMRLAHSEQGLDYLTNAFIDNQYNELLLWDTSLVYYPWGDARWRPYFKLGFGFADFDYVDAIGFRRSEMVYEMPFGFGMKYRVNQYWTWRFDVTDNLIFGGNAGLETQNQFSLAAGLEYRFGGRRQSYWPWNPSRRWR